VRLSSAVDHTVTGRDEVFGPASPGDAATFIFAPERMWNLFLGSEVHWSYSYYHDWDFWNVGSEGDNPTVGNTFFARTVDANDVGDILYFEQEWHDGSFAPGAGHLYVSGTEVVVIASIGGSGAGAGSQRLSAERNSRDSDCFLAQNGDVAFGGLFSPGGAPSTTSFYRAGLVTSFPLDDGFQGSVPCDLNEFGIVVGDRTTPEGRRQFWRWDTDTDEVTFPGDEFGLDDRDQYASSINDDGNMLFTTVSPDFLDVTTDANEIWFIEAGGGMANVSHRVGLTYPDLDTPNPIRAALLNNANQFLVSPFAGVAASRPLFLSTVTIT
jgi:hypothetical protein